MKRFFFLSILLTSTVLLAVGAHARGLNGKVAQTNFVDTIPIEYSGGRILLPVTIEGKTYHFAFDTGAQSGLIFSSLGLKRLNMAENDVSVSDYNGNESSMSVCQIPAFTVGKTTILNYPAVYVHGYSSEEQCDGLIGINFLHGLVTKIDVSHRQMIITDRKHFFDHEQRTKVKCHNEDGLIYVDYKMSYSTKRFRALLDTGDKGCLSLSNEHFKLCSDSTTNPYASAFKSQVTGQRRTTIAGVNGRVEQGITALTIKQFRIGRKTFHNLSAATTTSEDKIGIKFLEHSPIIIRKSQIEL